MDGLMTWSEAMAWADQLVYGGYDDWRLPIMAPGNQPPAASYNGTTAIGYGAPGAGYGTATPSGGWGPTGDADGIWSELGWMYYHNLSGVGYCIPDDVFLGSCGQHGHGIKNNVFFSELQRPYVAWFGTENNNGFAWVFDLSGGQAIQHKNNQYNAWAVRDGDVAAAPSSVPEPGSLALIGLGLMGLGWMRRRV
ncbi:MAG: PEP-CTERM sorting domain-containing protein [Candidatus Competibacteraceae bacterium]|nr:PEP-CTERM sorting domain-containing protein [Candidatus Competibacteraceae bacterium]